MRGEHFNLNEYIYKYLYVYINVYVYVRRNYNLVYSMRT